MNSSLVTLDATSLQNTSPASRKPHASSQVARRVRQISQLFKGEGIGAVADRLRKVAAERIAPSRTTPPVRLRDVIAADLGRPPQRSMLPVKEGERLLVNWVMTPPAPGSGGHTTLFRMLRYLEANGYRNRVYFYDAYGGDPRYYESIVGSYYGFHGPVSGVDSGMEDAHAVFATGWPTAYPVFNAACAGKRFYFVQDFEPFFYPVGSTSSLAEATYRMGFHGLMIGRSFAQKLRTEFGMTVDPFDFACDLSQYHRNPEAQRSDIVFYARKDSARRGLELGLMTLELFAQRRPEIQIHIYGDRLGKQRFPYHDHGRVSPVRINEIYNRCCAGLCLSFTNVSLVPLEMLAAGCIPVVNETAQVHTDLTNPFVVAAPAYPQALCAQLESVVDATDITARSAGAAASVSTSTWDEVGATVDGLLRRALGAGAAEGGSPPNQEHRSVDCCHV